LLVAFMNQNATVTSLWDITTIKEGDSKQTALPADFRCHVVAWQHVTPHCCMHSSAAEAIQVGIVWPSPEKLDLAPNEFHLFLHLRTSLALQNFVNSEELQASLEN
jgi:hypothetical protein